MAEYNPDVDRGKVMADGCRDIDYHGLHEFTVVCSLKEYRDLVETKERYVSRIDEVIRLKAEVADLNAEIERLKGEINRLTFGTAKGGKVTAERVAEWINSSTPNGGE
ncbi:MAG TPA: hypothetical protein DEV22_02740 [Collinsella sp.]|nr:hypothetical protein [Collinsella sp.]